METTNDVEMLSVPDINEESTITSEQINGLEAAMIRGANGDVLVSNQAEVLSNGFNDSFGAQSHTEAHLSKDRAILNSHVLRHQGSESPEKGISPSEDELLEDMDSYKMPPPSVRLRPKFLATGLCYDSRMRYHSELDPPKQRLDFHPEDPRRIFCIYEALCLAGLLQDPQFMQPAIVEKPLVRIAARHATAPEICEVHTAGHFQLISHTEDQNDLDLILLERAIETCKAVVEQIVKNAIAVIRPPGHHAEENRPMGFCLFDNVAIATKVCQKDYPDICRKVLILDWDVHHGNGIQHAFYQDPNVLYISIHVYEDGTFYPSLVDGNHLHCGESHGLGKNINIPWPTKGMGDADYLYAFQQVVMPVAYEFNPDLVIIAAGFDAADGDQLGQCYVTPVCYAHMTHMLMPLANGKLAVCLEGGYNLKSISKSALAVTRTLMGEAPDRLSSTKPTPSGQATVDMVKAYQARFWTSLTPGPATTVQGKQPLMNLDDGHLQIYKENYTMVEREYVYKELYDEFGMIELPIYRERLSKSFKNQVLATINYADPVPVFVIFHDPKEPPPHLADIVLVRNDTRRSTNSAASFADARKHDELDEYRKWINDQKFAIVDVNFPTSSAVYEDDEDAHITQDERETRRITEHEEMVIYLWENYIEPNDTTQIFFVGVGSPSKDIVHLLNTRENLFSRITGVVNFLGPEDQPIPVSDQNTYYLSKWFRA
ncbi:MAG: hypothetical protein Q9214_005052, partial [Letrouitia sp. 1 TL-2023]